MISKIKNFLKNMDRNMMMAAIAVIGLVIVAILIYANSNPAAFSALGFGPSSKQIAEKAIKYINDNGLSPSAPAELTGDVTQESGLIKFKIKIGTNEFDSYATKDGKLFFPQVFSMDGQDSGNQNAGGETEGKTAEEILASIKKSDKPQLEAYVVSRCPYGLQMQRMMASAFKSLPELSDYVKIKYMGSVSSDGKSITSMHGDEEAKENLRQICIRDEQASKYWNYVSCQMKAASTESSCEKSTGIDSVKLNACVSDPKRGVAYAKEDFAGQDKYGVTGSPTLILNEAQLQEFDKSNQPVFGGRTADALKTMVCDAFNTAAGFCSNKLDTTQAATSFSATYSSGDTGANANANCGS